jgi:hypothetical protein
VTSLLSLSINNSGSPVTPSVTLHNQIAGVNRYIVVIPINSPGTYTISSTKLTKYAGSVSFYVRSGQPDAKTQCSLDGYTSSPILQDGQHPVLTYTCELIDGKGYKINATWAKINYTLNYSWQYG